MNYCVVPTMHDTWFSPAFSVVLESFEGLDRSFDRSLRLSLPTSSRAQ